MATIYIIEACTHIGLYNPDQLMGSVLLLYLATETMFSTMAESSNQFTNSNLYRTFRTALAVVFKLHPPLKPFL